MSPEICLGSVQFGMDYGITNYSGKVKESEIKKILDRSYNCGIQLIDTAQAYGTSEKVLGKCINPKHQFLIISKLKKQKNSFSKNDISKWENNFQLTLNNLKTSKINGFLLHNSNDLLKEGSHFLKTWLKSLKQRKLVKEIGLSIYNSKDLNNIDLSNIDLVQLPLSIYDQRLLKDGTIHKLKNIGCKVFIRSVFLQGLILKSHKDWPSWVNQNNVKAQNRLERFAKEQNASLLKLALAFAKKQDEVDAVVIGITSRKELEEIISVWNEKNDDLLNDEFKWALEDETFLDPRNWNKSII